LLEQIFHFKENKENFSSHARTFSISYAVCANVSGTFLISLRFFASFLDNGWYVLIVLSRVNDPGHGKMIYIKASYRRGFFQGAFIELRKATGRSMKFISTLWLSGVINSIARFSEEAKLHQGSHMELNCLLLLDFDSHIHVKLPRNVR